MRTKLFSGAAGTPALMERRATALTVRRATTVLPTVRRAATVLLMMLLTTASAWAFKTEVKSYRITFSGTQFNIFPSGQSTPTVSWTGSHDGQNQNIYYWKSGESHSFDGNMTISPNVNVYSDNGNVKTVGQTKFTFNAPSGIITKVSFRNGDANVNLSNSSGADTSTYTVTLADNTTFTGFEVTFFATSGLCGENTASGTKATWELTTDDSNRYTVLTISGSGTMDNYNSSNNTAPWGNNLTSVTIGSNIMSIGDYAFYNCTSLTRVDIKRNNAGIVTLGSNGLSGCPSSLVIVAPTPALAVQYKTATNWSAYSGKMSAKFANYVFYATDQGGTAAYAITNEDDLCHLAAAINGNSEGVATSETFRQTENISLNKNFIPIGTNDNHCFTGTYDGGDNTISGLQISQSDGATFYGLFGYVKNGTVKNVRLVNPSVNMGNVSTSTNYGALIGYAYGSTVKNCVVINPTVEGSGGDKGAIIGENSGGTLQNLYFYGGNCDKAISNDGSYTSVGRARKVTIGSGISSVSPSATSMDNGFVYNNEHYYREGLALTLTTNLSATTGHHIVYKANTDKTISNTYTVNSTDGDVTFTAEQIINTYTVHFDGNGHTSGEMDDQAFTYDVAQNLTANAFRRSGYTFDGWATAGGDVVYADQQSVSNLTTTNGATVTLYAKWTLIPVTYIDADGKPQTSSNHTVLTNKTDVSNLGGGWYVVAEDVTYNSRFYCNSGDIHLILCDNAKMTVTPDMNDVAIYVRSGSLTIYAQSTGSSMGQLEATSINNIGIYTNNLTICGGKITATGEYSYGISANGNVTIHSGQVSATGNLGGIYTATNFFIIIGLRNATDYLTASKYLTTIYIADGQTLTDGTNLYSGELEEKDAICGKTLRRATQADYMAYFGSGIDGSTSKPYTISDEDGWNAFCLALQDNDTWNRFIGKTVKLGNNIGSAEHPITRMAGSDYHDFCGTFDGNQKTLTVKYGSIDNRSNENNVAPFRNLQSGCIIKDLHVTGDIYTWAQFAGGLAGTMFGTVKIENCLVSTVIHSRTNHESPHGVDGTHGGIVGLAGNNSSTNLTIEGCVFDGKLLDRGETTSSSGFVGYKHGTVTIRNSIYAPAALDTDTYEMEITTNSATFMRNAAEADITNCYYTRTLGTAQGLGYSLATLPANIGTAGTAYSVSGITPYTRGLHYNGHYYMAPEAISLDDASANDIAGLDGYFADVTLTGRKLYKDRDWNTLCLPFDVALTDPYFEFATVMELNNSEGSNTGFDAKTGTLTLDFVEAHSINAGHAYIVKWTTTGDPIENPVFHAVTIQNEVPADQSASSRDGSVTFKGTYDAIPFTDTDRSVLLLGSYDMLYWPQPDLSDPAHPVYPSIGAFRAYFQLNGGITAGNVANARLSFGEDSEAQGISLTPDPSPKGEGSIYTLDGVKLDKMPTRKGVYIQNGRKVVMK